MIFRASKRNFLVFEMGFWISEVDGREGAHSRRSALPRPPSADTDASNTVGSSERRAVGSPGFQLGAGLRVRSPGDASLSWNFPSDLPCRSLSPPSRRREPRARPCPGPPRAPAATVPPSSARGRARYAPDDRPIARVTVRAPDRTRGTRRRVASWPKGQFITWPPGVLVVSPAETYRAYRAVPGRPNVSRRSRVGTRSHFDPERRPEDRVEHPSN